MHSSSNQNEDCPESDKALIIVGTSLDLLSLALELGRNIKGFVDQRSEKRFEDFPILGNDEAILKNTQLARECDIAIALDKPSLRAQLAEKYHAAGFSFATLCAGKIQPGTQIGEGALILPGSEIREQAHIGSQAKIGLQALIGHEVQIGENAFIGPRALVCGLAKVGKGASIGANATVSSKITIGENSQVSPGSVILRNVPPGHQVFGHYPLPGLHRILPLPEYAG